MKRKTIALMTTLILAASLSACGGNTSGETNHSDSVKIEESKKETETQSEKQADSKEEREQSISDRSDEEALYEKSGKCGNGKLTWHYKDGVLVISGNGDLDNSYTVPWKGLTIEKVVIEDGVTSIGEMTFQQHHSLTEITIPDSVVDIGDHAFSGCDSLKEIPLPASLTGGIKAWTFMQCTSLTSITIPDSVTGSIGEFAFDECKNLTEVTIGNSITSVEKAAFTRCGNLTKAVIGNSVTEIEESAFSECESLTELVIGSSVKNIGSHSFSSCKNLMEIEFPDSLTTIGDYAFWGCESVERITIPASVTSIGGHTFNNCENLKEIIFEGDRPEGLEQMMSGTNGLPELRNVVVYYTGMTFDETINSRGSYQWDNYGIKWVNQSDNHQSGIGREGFLIQILEKQQEEIEKTAGTSSAYDSMGHVGELSIIGQNSSASIDPDESYTIEGNNIIYQDTVYADLYSNAKKLESHCPYNADIIIKCLLQGYSPSENAVYTAFDFDDGADEYAIPIDEMIYADRYDEIRQTYNERAEWEFHLYHYGGKDWITLAGGKSFILIIGTDEDIIVDVSDF